MTKISPIGSTRFQCNGDLALLVDHFAAWFNTLPDWIVVFISEIKCQHCGARATLPTVPELRGNWQEQMEKFAKKHGDCE